MKIGLWLPFREKLSSVSADHPGYLLKEVQEKIVRTLKKDKELEVIENLDFRKAVIKNGSVYLNDFCFDDLDVFLWFGEIGREESAYSVEVLHSISKKCRVINDPVYFEIGLDKFKSLELLRKEGISVPEIMLFSNEGIEQMKEIFFDWKEVVIKPRTGAYGIGTVKVQDDQTLVDVLDYANKNKVHYVEKFIPNEIDEWMGVNAVNGKIIYGYGKEKSQIKNWKIQDRNRQGGHMVIKKPNKEQREIALKVGEITGLGIYGVDLIKGIDGKYYVVDVNTFPGLYPELIEKAETDMYEEILTLVKGQ